MPRLSCCLSVVLTLALTACSWGGSADRAPQPSTYEPLPPPELNDSSLEGTGGSDSGAVDQGGAVNQGGTYPYGTTPTPETESGSGGEAVVIRAPVGSLWRGRNSVSEAQYQADARGCHAYAAAQSRHDSQIYDDRNAASDTLTTNSGFAVVQQQRQEYDIYRRRIGLMEECMRSRGYARF